MICSSAAAPLLLQPVPPLPPYLCGAGLAQLHAELLCRLALLRCRLRGALQLELHLSHSAVGGILSLAQRRVRLLQLGQARLQIVNRAGSARAGLGLLVPVLFLFERQYGGGKSVSRAASWCIALVHCRRPSQQAYRPSPEGADARPPAVPRASASRPRATRASAGQSPRPRPTSAAAHPRALEAARAAPKVGLCVATWLSRGSTLSVPGLLPPTPPSWLRGPHP